MKFTDELIARYAKKVYGFAYNKMHSTADAEDLSQDILLEICKIDFDKKSIANMDSYIYKVCEYTYSNYVRRHSKEWDNTYYSEDTYNIASDYSLESEVTESDLYSNLRREVMYLAKTKREVIIMYYYEGRSGKEIAEMLSIPHSTVRWYLGEAKKNIKEHIDMENSIYTPKKLNIGFSGTCHSTDMGGLREDLLTQNICLVCQGKALTVEEIARELCMSAAFIEDKLEKLIHMNYLEQVGSNKYRCTFFVMGKEWIRARVDFYKEADARLAPKMYAAAEKCFDDIVRIGFVGCDLDKNYLMWSIITEIGHSFCNDYGPDFEWNPPIRGDGSKFYVNAWLKLTGKDYFPEDEALAEYADKYSGSNGKHFQNTRICVRQHDPRCVVAERGLESWGRMDKLERAYNVIVNAKEPDEFDKEAIADLCSIGYVKMEDGKAKLMIPYMTKAEWEEFETVIKSAAKEIYDAERGIFEDYARHMAKCIPDYVSAEDKEFRLASFDYVCAAVYKLLRDGKIAEPTDEEKRVICTIAHEM